LTLEKATKEIEINRNKQWNSDVVDAFLAGVKNGTISIEKAYT
jgi:hypothetical protein